MKILERETKGLEATITKLGIFLASIPPYQRCRALTLQENDKFQAIPETLFQYEQKMDGSMKPF